MLTFDGPNRKIIVPLGTIDVAVQSDVYSAWKHWVKTSDNSKYVAALRTTGGDPFGGGEFLGAYFFLINQWQLQPTSGTIKNVILDGNLKHDDGLDIVDTVGTDVQLWQNVVSSLTTQTSPTVTVTGSGLTPSESAQLDNIETMGSYTTASLDHLTLINYDQTASLDELISLNREQTGSLDALISLNNQQTGSLETIEFNTELILAGSGSAAGLTPDQAEYLLTIYQIMGLDPTKPLIVSPVARSVDGEVSQSISKTGEVVTVTRTS